MQRWRLTTFKQQLKHATCQTPHGLLYPCSSRTMWCLKDPGSYLPRYYAPQGKALVHSRAHPATCCVPHLQAVHTASSLTFIFRNDQSRCAAWTLQPLESSLASTGSGARFAYRLVRCLSQIHHPVRHVCSLALPTFSAVFCEASSPEIIMSPTTINLHPLIYSFQC